MIVRGMEKEFIPIPLTIIPLTMSLPVLLIKLSSRRIRFANLRGFWQTIPQA